MLKLRRTIAVVFTALAVVITVLYAEPAGASPGAFTSKINSLRASKGLGDLSTNGSLNAQAQRWAETMASQNKISHNPSLGSTPGNWTKVGENVGTGGSVDSIFNALVASPGHYRNMVEGKFNSVGVGVATGSDGRIYTCHVFASFPGAGGGGGGGSAVKSSGGGGKAKAAAPAAAKSGSPARAASSSSGSAGGSTSGGSGGASAPSGGNSAAPAAAVAPVAVPSDQIVTGLGEVGAIHLQG